MSHQKTTHAYQHSIRAFMGFPFLKSAVPPGGRQGEAAAAGGAAQSAPLGNHGDNSFGVGK